MEKLLVVNGLSVSVGSSEIVRSISFSINPGERLCLVGESGSGKTTTSLAVMRLLSKKRGFRTTGSVCYQGNELLEMPQKACNAFYGPEIAMIFQDPSASLNPILSIGEQIQEMFLIHTDLSEEESEAKVLDALASVGLGKIAHPFHIYPHELSGGMKQRVMIAMALALGPKLLIADEPTSALDLTVQKEILGLLKRFTGAMLIITHDFGVVAEMADMVAVLYKGEIVEYANVHDIFTKPSHPYTKRLLAARPTKENRKKKLAV